MNSSTIDSRILHTSTHGQTKLFQFLKHQNEVNEPRAERITRTTNPLTLVAQQQPVYHPQNHPTNYTQNSSTRSQQAATRNRGKVIVNSPPPIYDIEPSMVAEDDKMSKDKEIDKVMALISLSFKKIYKPTKNNIRTSSNSSRANQDNSPRINRATRYENQRIGNVVGAREIVGTTVVQKSRIQCYNCKEFRHVARECQKLKRAKEAAYYKEKMLLCKQEEAVIQLNAEQADWRDDTDDVSENQELEAHYIEHLEQSKSINDTYPNEQDEHNVIIDSIDMSYDREQIDQNDDDLANERMYKLHTKPTQTRTTQLPHDSRKTNKRVSFSKGVIPTTSVSRPQVKSNQMEDKVLLNNSQGKKQKVEDHRRNVKLSKNNTSVTACNDSLNAKTLNVNFICATCGKYVLNVKHDMCILKSHNGMNSWTKILIVVPVSTREPKRTVKQSVAKPLRKILIEIILFIVDSGCSKHMMGNIKLLTNFMEKFLGMVKFGNDQIAPILGYGDLVQGAVTIKRVYYVEGLNHNLFSVGQLCDADLEVAFWKSTCYIRDLKGNDLLIGSRGTNLYSITLQDTSSPNLICLMAKATSSHAWLWHRCLSHLNFVTINLLSKNDIVIGLPMLKFIKDHLCSSSIINGKKYVLLIVDDYPRYTSTHFLRSKDETPKVLIDFLRLVQRGLHAQVRTIRTDKGTNIFNKTLHAYFAVEGINHQMSIAQTPKQNDVVESWNRTLVEASRTMLSAAKVPFFFWAEAIATTCFTQNRSLVIPRHEKTPYHIINDRKPSIKFFYIFGSLCYIVRDGENLDKIKEKGDACIFVGYSTQSRAYMVFNKRTRVIVETIHVNFDELPQMASDHVSSDPVPQCQKTALEHDSLSLGPQCQENVAHAARTVTTSNELDLLFSPMFDELLNGSTQVVSKSFAKTTADAHNQCLQQHTTPLNTRTTTAPSCQVPTQAQTVTSTENINQAEMIEENAQVENDEFVNIFCTPVQDRKETSTSSQQVIGNPSQSVITRRQLESDSKMCMFALIVSRTKLKNLKEAMADSAWIESMQEELHQFDRLDV
nr:hypothetical protein [Tanacetum cinerariifolium]